MNVISNEKTVIIMQTRKQFKRLCRPPIMLLHGQFALHVLRVFGLKSCLADEANCDEKDQIVPVVFERTGPENE